MGFAIALPIGAISVLYIKRTLEHGVSSGIVSAVGVSAAETLYAIVAIYGLSFVSNFLVKWQLYLQLVGGLFLFMVGLKCFFSKPILHVALTKKQSLIADGVSMFFLSLLNPLALIGFMAIFAGIGIGNFEGTFFQSLITVVGFATASFSYCIFLISIAGFLRSKFDTRDTDLMKVLSQMSGLMMMLLVVYIVSFSVFSS